MVAIKTHSMGSDAAVVPRMDLAWYDIAPAT